MTALNKSIKEGAPAFPGVGAGRWWAGMSLRDYFAAQAMQALLSNNKNACESDIAKYAYIQADAMLEARK